jgi:MFS family permease
MSLSKVDADAKAAPRTKINAKDLDTEGLTEAQRQKAVMLLKASTFLSICQHTIMIQTEPYLIKELCMGDVARGQKLLANTQGLVGIIGLLLNQMGGRLSDSFGRRRFLLVGPLCNILLGLTVFNRSKSLLTVLVCRVLRMVVTTFSNTVMISASLADVCSGKDLAAQGSKIGAVVGLSMVCAPLLESFLLKWTKSMRSPYLALSILGMCQVAMGSFLMPETLAESRRSKVSNAMSLETFNPFGFLNVFKRGSSALKKLVTITSFQMFLEGKNLSDQGMTWMHEHLKWNTTQTGNYIVAYGLLCVWTGQYLTPWLMQRTTSRSFTTITDLLQAAAYFLRGSAESAAMWWLTIPLILPGVNGNTAQRLKALAVDRATSEGFGKGEFSAWSNNLRAIAGSISPVIYGHWYASCCNKRIMAPPGSVYWLAAVLGALVPEFLLTFATDKDLENVKS